MEETTTAITAVKEEVRLHDWAAQVEAQQATLAPHTQLSTIAFPTTKCTL